MWCEVIMEAKTTSDETLDILLLIRRTRDVIQAVRQKELLKYGITPEHAAVLHILSDLGGSARPTDISLWLFRKRQSVHDLLDRMEKAGFIKKAKDPARKNGIMIVLTDQGRLLNKKTSKLTVPTRIVASLSKRERGQLRNALDRLLTIGQNEAGIDDRLPLRPLTLQNNRRTRRKS